MRSNHPSLFAAICFAIALGSPAIIAAQESVADQSVETENPPAVARSAVDADGRVVNFQRDIAPIFAARCLECHQGEKAKADFRIDQRDSVMGYVEPEDVELSMLYTDYMIAEDPDMMMPPPSKGGPLLPPELALVRLWIEEGADWPEDAVVVGPDATAVTMVPQTSVPTAAAPIASRIWAFQGYFHPATVHFPIALLSIGGLFVLLGLKWPKLGTQVPLACLLLGSVSAVVASAMGWAFAAEQGYPGYEAGWEQDINSHRWSGTIVAAAAVVLALLALLGIKRESKPINFVWKAGLLALALTVGLRAPLAISIPISRAVTVC
jgi:uncharacterized membrane protein